MMTVDRASQNFEAGFDVAPCLCGDRSSSSLYIQQAAPNQAIEMLLCASCGTVRVPRPRIENAAPFGQTLLHNGT